VTTPWRQNQTITYREAMREAMREALRTDERVFLMGEDVGRYGGCFAVSQGPARGVRARAHPRHAAVGVGLRRGRHRRRLGGMRPIVEIMTVNFSLLALDQIVNNAATLLHMSGGQFNVPLVIRMTTGAGRQLAAQHSHSLEGWYAHIPGLRWLAPATVDDARWMLWPGARRPRPGAHLRARDALQRRGRAADDAGPVDLDRAACAARAATSPSSPTAGPCPTLAAAEELAGRRDRRRGDRPAHAAPPRRRHDPRPRSPHPPGRRGRRGLASGALSAEISARITEHVFYELDAPVARVCSAEVPIPYAKHLEAGRAPPASRDHRRRRVRRSGPPWVSSGCRRSAPTWTAARCSSGRSRPATPCTKGDIVAVVDTEKSDIEVERARDLTLPAGQPGPAEPGPATPIALEPAPEPAPAPDRSTRMRAMIAGRMARANRDIPHYFLERQVDLGPLTDRLSRENESRPIRDRILAAAAFVRATALAAARHPELNGHWVDDHFRPGAGVNVAVAISLRGGGLLTPSIEHADDCSLQLTMAKLQEFTLAARSGSLSEDLARNSLVRSSWGR
jgi:pyruvate dehydrogenase E1 component beta subunit